MWYNLVFSWIGKRMTDFKDANSRLVVAGATGHLGRRILEVLESFGYPASLVVALGSKASGAVEVSYGMYHKLPAFNLDKFTFKKDDIVISALPNEVTRKLATRALALGCTVIDSSNLYSNVYGDVPVIVPEINPIAIKQYAKHGVIASPSALTVQMALILHPLSKIAPISRIVAATYQAVSCSGKRAMDELFTQTRQGFSGPSMAYKSEAQPEKVFNKRIAFNCIPQVGDFLEGGVTEEEARLQSELQRIFNKDLPLSVTCAYVPVFVGNGIALNVEFAAPVDLTNAEAALGDVPWIGLVSTENEAKYLTQIECVQDDLLLVSRLRRDNSVAHGLSLWLTMDNVRRGVAINVMQILRLFLDYRQGVELEDWQCTSFDH